MVQAHRSYRITRATRASSGVIANGYSAEKPISELKPIPSSVPSRPKQESQSEASEATKR